MNSQEEQLANLQSRLSKLSEQNQEISGEIKQLKTEIRQLADKLFQQGKENPVTEIPENVPSPVAETVGDQKEKPWKPVPEIPEIQEEEQPAWQANLEKFIGENLISKIGILITIIGVAIGTKYAIDHELISPVTRIILGYILGTVIAGFAVKLKSGYHNFSAVLCSGSMAIFYLITFAAFAYFGLVPRWTAFMLMALVTIVTVVSAIWYDRQVIAHIGLVGAYAVPFLLDDGSGRFEIMFSYMAIINAGILTVSLIRYWKYLHFSSFILTWIIVLLWYLGDQPTHPEIFPAMGFLAAFFLIFYLLLIGYKFINEQQVEIEDVLLLIANSGIFYLLGYELLRINNGNQYEGLFTLILSAIHASVWLGVRLKRSKDPALLYFTGGLSLTFLTLAIPVQFDGSVVTLLYATETVLFFYAGRVKGIVLMEKFALCLLFLTMFSIFHDYSVLYSAYIPGKAETRLVPLFNINFLVSFFVIASFTLNTWWLFKVPCKTENQLIFLRIQKIIIPAVLILVVYLAFFMEINSFANQLYADSKIITFDKETGKAVSWNENIRRTGFISLLSYSLLFCSGLLVLNRKYFRSSLLALIIMLCKMIVLTFILSFGLILIGELRNVYITGFPAQFYHGIWLILLRYILILFLAGSMYILFKAVHDEGNIIEFKSEFDIVMHFVILVILSNELVNWLDLARFENSFKLGLSILFGSYAVLMIIQGILARKKHVRIGAMALFGLTLIKLFIYDLAGLDTISRTIVFLSLGILLLVMAFLYNKFTRRIFGEHSEN